MKKKIRYATIAVLMIPLVILAWPTFSLLLMPHISFDFQLLALVFILICLLVFALYKFVIDDWSDDALLAFAALFFAVLFFVSDGSKTDLATLQSLKSATSYNCLVAGGILKEKDSVWNISYSQYQTDEFLNNLGFTAEKYGPTTEAVVGVATYDMIYSNRLLDAITRLNVPTNLPQDNLRLIEQEKIQVEVLAAEISKSMNCPQ